MKRKYRWAALALSASLVLGTASAAFAEERTATREYVISEFVQSVGRRNLPAEDGALDRFTDRDTIGEPFSQDCARAASAGLIAGYEDGTLRPKASVERVEALVVLSRCIPELTAVGDAIEFSDVPEWAKKDIDRLSSAGLVYGYGDGTLGASDSITEEQVKLLTDRTDAVFNTSSPEQDFYEYINSKAFRNADMERESQVDMLHSAILTQENSWSHWSDMNEQLLRRESALLEKLMDGEVPYETGDAEQRVHDMLECISTRDQDNPENDEIVRNYRTKILNAKTVSELLEVTTEIYLDSGINILFDVKAGLDPDTHTVYPSLDFSAIGYGGLLVFDQNSDTAQHKQLYRSVMKDYLDSCGASFTGKELEQASRIQEICANDVNYLNDYVQYLHLRQVADENYTDLNFRDDMAELCRNHPALYDPDTKSCVDTAEWVTTYSMAEADTKIDGLKISELLLDYGFDASDAVILPREDLLKEKKGLLSEDNLAALKINALLKLGTTLQYHTEPAEKENLSRLNIFSAGVLTHQSFEQIYYAMNHYDETAQQLQMLMGRFSTTTKLSMENLQLLTRLLPDDIGILYCRYYYDDETFEKVGEMTDLFWDAFMNRIEANTRLSDSAKEAALAKIDNMWAIIGYPDNYEFPEILSASEGGTYFKNLLSILRGRAETERRSCRDQEFMRTTMLLSADTVNACYVPGLNTLNIPAGIIQAPIYDPEADDAANIGALGAVIAHELARAFDKNGSQYDENGCRKDWWTEQDKTTYADYQKKFADYFLSFKTEDVVLNTATIETVMADFAGLQAVMDVIGDDPQAQRSALESYANMWARIGTESYVTGNHFLSDTNASNRIRVNACVASMDCFYDLYEVKEGDPMYVEPERRLKLW